MSTVTRNQVPGMKVDGTYILPRFREIVSNTAVFKSAWNTTIDDTNWTPCVIKLSDFREVLTVRSMRLSMTEVNFEQRHLVDVKPWMPSLDRARYHGTCGVSMPRYPGVLSEFTHQFILPSSTLILKHIEHISVALETLHSHRWIHMDVKPSNVFLNHQCDAFLGDFGSCTMIGDVVESLTPGYTIEEIPNAKANPLLDWVGLLLTALHLLRKLDFSAQPQPLQRVRDCIDGMRGDTDVCHIAVVNIYDLRIARHVE